MNKIKKLLVFTFIIVFVFSPVLGNIKKVSAAPGPGFTAQPYYINYNNFNYYTNLDNGSTGNYFFIGEHVGFKDAFSVKKTGTFLDILDGSKDLYVALLTIYYDSNLLGRLTFYTDNTESEINAKILEAEGTLPIDISLDFYSSKPIWIHHGAGYDYSYDSSALPEGATMVTDGYTSSDLQISYDGVVYNTNVTNIGGSDEGTHIFSNINSSTNEIIFLFKNENPTNIILGVDDTKNFDLILFDEIPDMEIGHTAWLVPSGFDLEAKFGFSDIAVCRESDVFVSNGVGQDYTFKPLNTWTGCATPEPAKAPAPTVLGNENPTFSYETFPLTLTTTAPVPTLTTEPATGITKNSVTLNGSIADMGFENAAVRGFRYGKDTNYGEQTTENAPFDTGKFSAEISSLECGTLYHYQSYADNSLDTGYGEDKTFTTSDCARHTSSGSYMPGYGPRANVVPVVAPTTPTAPETKFIFTKNLKKGMIDNDVKELQKFLNSKGFTVALNGAGSNGFETTLFGSLTQKALIKFQLANKISPAIGFFGPITRGVVNQ